MLAGMSTIDELVREAGKLPNDQKLTLANRVLEMSEGEVESDVEESWDSELGARVDAYDRGRTSTTTAAEVFEKVDTTLQS